jgi:DNA primase
VHAQAVRYFQEALTHREGEEASEYLKSRGIDSSMISRFGLGYAPRGWSGLLTEMRKCGITAQELESAGLAVERIGEAFTHYDRFRHRIIFSIRDIQGRVIAFGGRVLDDSVPKYLNSPETMFFNKSRNLYALDLAIRDIRGKGLALLMEGYMDVIAAHKMGFTTAVASLGTALTREQARLLRKYTTRVLICYDGDTAGIQAAVRAGEILVAEELDACVVDLSPAKDPDEFLATASAEEFEKRLQAATPYLEFKFKTLLESQGSRSTRSAQDKARLIRSIAPDIISTKSPVVRESTERFIAQELGITYEAVGHELFQIESKRKNSKKTQVQTEDFQPIQDISVRNRNTIEEKPSAMAQSSYVLPGILRAEQLILRVLLEAPGPSERAELASLVVGEMGTEFWSVEGHKTIFDRLFETADLSLPTLYAALAAEADYEDICMRLAAVLEIEYTQDREKEMIQDCLVCLRDAQNREDIEKMQSEAIRLENMGDITGAMGVLQEIGERLRRG